MYHERDTLFIQNSERFYAHVPLNLKTIDPANCCVPP